MAACPVLLANVTVLWRRDHAAAWPTRRQPQATRSGWTGSGTTAAGQRGLQIDRSSAGQDGHVRSGRAQPAVMAVVAPFG